MKFAASVLFLLASLSVGTAHANDGGVYSVQPYGAKLDKAAQSFTFTGQYAQELKKLLPPSFSVLTGMEPALTNAFNKHFRGLMMKDAAGNAMSLSCESGSLEFVAEGKHLIKDKPEVTCTVQMLDKAAAAESDSPKLQVKDALQKAQQANQL